MHDKVAAGKGGAPKGTFFEYAKAKCKRIAAEALALRTAREQTVEWQLPFRMARAVLAHPDAQRYREATVKTASLIWEACLEVQELYPTREDFLMQFQKGWKDVKYPEGMKLLEAAVERLRIWEPKLSDENMMDATAGYIRFIGLCGHLCVLLGRDLIKLPCREVAAVLEVRPATVTAYRQKAVEQGYLVEKLEHFYKPSGKGEATTFRFAVERWEYIREKVKNITSDEKPTAKPDAAVAQVDRPTVDGATRWLQMPGKLPR